jgi:DNA-binding HxlR family transcriptional regulator
VLPKNYDTQDCSVARALEVVGERWTLLIVRECLLGTRHFDEFQSRLGIASNVLSSRLSALVDDGILQQDIDPDDARRKVYELTRAGRELGVVVEALREWGDRNSDGHPPVRMTHIDCGGDLQVEIRCTRCGEQVGRRDIARRETRSIRRPAS